MGPLLSDRVETPTGGARKGSIVGGPEHLPGVQGSEIAELGTGGWGERPLFVGRV